MMNPSELQQSFLSHLALAEQGRLPLAQLFTLSDTFQAAAEQEMAIQLYAAWIAHSNDPNKPMAMFNYGFNLFQAGQTERGVAQMEQGLAKGIARNADLARLRLISVYAELKQRDKALPVLQALAGKADLIGMDDCARYWTLLLR